MQWLGRVFYVLVVGKKVARGIHLRLQGSGIGSFPLLLRDGGHGRHQSVSLLLTCGQLLSTLRMCRLSSLHGERARSKRFIPWVGCRCNDGVLRSAQGHCQTTVCFGDYVIGKNQSLRFRPTSLQA